MSVTIETEWKTCNTCGFTYGYAKGQWDIVCPGPYCRYRREHLAEHDRIKLAALSATNSALRGVITRLKRKDQKN